MPVIDIGAERRRCGTIDLRSETTHALIASEDSGHALARSLGIAPKAHALAPGGGLGVSKVRFIGNSLYEPDPHGVDAIVAITYQDYGGNIEDLIAFTTDQFGLRIGNARYLGEANMLRRGVAQPLNYDWPLMIPTTRTDERLLVNSSPIDWHLHNCRGVFPLCARAYFELVNIQSELSVTSDESANRVYRMMRFPSENTPEIYIVGGAA